jgi:hypothetical protein
MDLLKDLAGTWHELTKAQQLAAAQAAAGIRHYNSFIILMNNFDEALEASAHAATAQGFALRKNQLAMQTLSKQMNVMKESLKGLGLEVGKAIVPTVTAATKALSVLLNVASKIPGPMLQIGTLGLGGMLAFHKAADMVVDSLDAMMGYGNEGPKLKKFFGQEGYIGGIGKGAKKAFKGVFGGIGSALGIMMSKAVNFGPGAMKPTGVFNPKEQGLIVRGLDGMGRGVMRLASALGTMRMLALGAAGALAAVAGVLLYKWYQRVTTTGKDVADQMYDQIGKARDLADSYRAQATQLSRVSVAQRKLASARKLSSDDPKMATAIASGEFKGAALAARDLRDITLDVGRVIAKIDPTSITDISDSGEFIWDMSDGFKSLAGNAVEAQNAIVAMMQVKVMKAFAEDVTEAHGALDNWSEAWNSITKHLPGVDSIDLSLSGKLKESQKVLQNIAKQRREAADRGWDAVGIEEQHISALERHLNIQEQIGESAQKLKEILDRMPNFESFETFKAVAGSNFWDALNVGAASGKFGAGATASSIAFDRMAQEAPATGAMVDYRSAANPAWMIEGLLEKGVKPEVYGQGSARGTATAADIMPLATGEIMVASRAIAEALLKETAPEIEARDALDPIRSQSITAMQSLISSVDKDTGAAIWKWANAAADGFDAASADTMSRIIAAVDDQEANLAIYRAKSIEEAGRATERLLTMQFTGALAGIRDPGGFDIGVGTRSELTAEQRVMESLPTTLQRLVDLQKEMAEIQRTYNEQLGEGNVQEASAQMAKSAGAVKVMDNQLKELVMTLQAEGFETSRALHYNLAIKDLSKTLEEAAIVAEDAARAEDRRTQFVKHTSGALAGLPELPSLTFGKSKKDLTGLERLQQRMPGLSKIVKGFDKLLKTKDSMLGVLTDVDKKKATFERAMDDLAASGEKLSDEQLKVRAVQLAKGIGAGERAILKTMKDVGESQIDYMKSQTEIQSAILDILGISATNTRDFSQEDMRAYNQSVKEALNASSRTQLEAAARELPASARARALESATGVKMIPRDKREYPKDPVTGKREQAFRIDKYAQQAIFGKNIPDDFKKLAVALKDVKQKIYAASQPVYGDPGSRGEGEYFPEDLEKLSAQEDAIISKLLLIGKARDAYTAGLDDELSTYIGANRSAAIQAEKAKSIGRLQRAKIETAKQQLLASKYFNDTQIAIISQLGDANSALQRAAPHLRLSSAAEDLAKSLEDLIYDFKKAEMLELDPDRIKSDLEGPFARVGKPGFKTDFETRREEAEAKLYGRGSKEEKEEARKEIIKIEFDIDEAKLKQKQDIEIKELKKQQDQASKFRDIMAEAMSSGEYAGTELSGRMKNFFTTLGHELETAEEASMRGGELKFKGIPSLQGVKGLIAEIKAFAEKKAKAAEFELMKNAFEKAGMKEVKANTDHLSKFADAVEDDVKAQTASLSTIVDLMQGGKMGEHVVAALGVLATEIARLREAQRTQAAQRAPDSSLAANTPAPLGFARGGIVPGARTASKDSVPAMLTPGEQVLTAQQATQAAGTTGATMAAAAGAFMKPMNNVVRQIYQFEDGMHAVVTRLKKTGQIIGSQTFEMQKDFIKMGDSAVVNKEFRGRGVMSEQLEAVFRFGKEKGVKTVGASDVSLAESQRSAYSRAAHATGADVRMAKLGTQVEFDSEMKDYTPKGDYEGRVLDVDLKNVEASVETGVKKGSQRFLKSLEHRIGAIEGVAAPAEIVSTIDREAAEIAELAENRRLQKETLKALKAKAAGPADAHLVALELREALAGNKLNAAKAQANAPADAHLIAAELKEALAGNKNRTAARLLRENDSAVQNAANQGQVRTERVEGPLRPNAMRQMDEIIDPELLAMRGEIDSLASKGETATQMRNVARGIEEGGEGLFRTGQVMSNAQANEPPPIAGRGKGKRARQKVRSAWLQRTGQISQGEWDARNMETVSELDAAEAAALEKQGRDYMPERQQRVRANLDDVSRPRAGFRVADEVFTGILDEPGGRPIPEADTDFARLEDLEKYGEPSLDADRYDPAAERARATRSVSRKNERLRLQHETLLEDPWDMRGFDTGERAGMHGAGTPRDAFAPHRWKDVHKSISEKGGGVPSDEAARAATKKSIERNKKKEALRKKQRVKKGGKLYEEMMGGREAIRTPGRPDLDPSQRLSVAEVEAQTGVAEPAAKPAAPEAPKVKEPGRIRKAAKTARGKLPSMKGIGKFAFGAGGALDVYQGARIGIESEKAISEFDQAGIQEQAGEMGGWATILAGGATGAAIGAGMGAPIGGVGALPGAALGFLGGTVATGGTMLYEGMTGKKGGLTDWAAEKGRSVDESLNHAPTAAAATVADMLGLPDFNRRTAATADYYGEQVGHDETGTFRSWARDVDINPFDKGSMFDFGGEEEQAAAAPAAIAKPRTQDEWMQRIAEIQTTAPGPPPSAGVVAGLPDFEMWGAETGESQADALARANTAGKMFLPSEFAPAPPMGPGTPKVVQGTARTDYTGDAGFFTQEQQFKAPGAGHSGPRQAFEGVRSSIDEAGAVQSVLKALARGERVFKPTGVGESLFNQPGGAQGGAQAYIENLRSARERNAASQVGASNIAAVTDSNAAANLGVPAVQGSDPTLGGAGQTQPRGATAAAEAAAAPTPTGGGEASQAVAQALETINATLATLSQTPLSIPDSLATTIEAGSAAVVEKLNDVTVTSMPAVEIGAASITSISSNISTATSLSNTAGAQQIIAVDDLKNELIEDGGLIDTRISATTESFEAKILQGEAESLETKAIVDSHTAELGTINETLPAVEADITGLKSTDLDLAVKVDLNAVEINTLDTEVTRVAEVSDTTATTVEGFQGSIDDVLATSAQVTTRIGQFEEEFITISQDVSDAKSDAADATLAVDDLKVSLADLRDSLSSKDTQIEATISINAEAAKKTRDTVFNDHAGKLSRLRDDVNVAISVARKAQNTASGKKG